MQPGKNRTFDQMSAIDQLSVVERHYVDEFIDDLVDRCIQTGQPIITALDIEISPSMIEQSRGFLARPLICAAIAERIRALSSERDLTWRRVIEEHKALAFSDITDYPVHQMLGTDPATGHPMVRYDQLNKRLTCAIKKLKLTIPTNPYGAKVLEIELFPKQPSLDKLTDVFGMTSDGNPYRKQLEQAAMTGRDLRHNVADIDDEKAADAYARLLRNEPDE